jgi:membrane-bound lytic murein transglycosylase D
MKTSSRLVAGLLALGLAGPLAADPADHAWAGIVDRLAFSDCPADGAVADWRRHYVDHPQELGRALNRAEPWLALVLAELERRDLPGELALVPIIESGYDPFAFSSQGAAGGWQFLADTALELGLDISPTFDARRDMLSATPAALDYLEQMYHRLGRRWELALAGYNAGPGRVARALAEAGTDASIDQIALPGETRSYLARLSGLSCLLANATAHGIDLPQLSRQPAFDVVKLAGPTDLVAVALESGIAPEALLWLNAGLAQLVTPAQGPHRLLVPAGQGELVQPTLPRARAAGSLVWDDNNVRRRDSLAGIARRHDVSLRALEHLNALDGELPVPGQRLQLPAPRRPERSADYARMFEHMLGLLQGRLPEWRLRHHVLEGENLWMLSQRYSVPASAIRRANGLGPQAEIRTGQWIEIPPHELATGPDQYRIQPGDTLSTIARDHGLAVTRLKQLNQLRADSLLVPGQVISLGEPRCCDQIPSLFLP